MNKNRKIEDKDIMQVNVGLDDRKGSKRQQPNQRTENSPKLPMGLQHSQKILYLEEGFSWPLNKNVYLFRENGSME